MWHCRGVADHAFDERTVTVGIDGSPGSAVALRWAIEHADGLGRVVPVAAFVAGPFEHEFGTHTRSEVTAAYFRDEMEALLAQFLEQTAPELVDEGVVIERPTGPGLVDASIGSELLVLGTRGWSAREGLAIGSVGAYCARHAEVPVALIPHDAPPVHDRLSVVVGVDGSPQSERALRWALNHVRRTAVVTAVRVTTAGSIVGDPLSVPSEEVAAAAARELQELVQAVRSEADGHPEVQVLVVHGDPREQLGTAVDNADLLVVGARGHGVIHRLLLGSVAMALVDHPTLPTIVVPYDGV
jgi:nucleotide-binding universal stress UspA family protein